MIGITSWLPLLAVFQTTNAIRYLGRVNPATKELTWSATGVSFTFTGTSATIGIEALSGANSAELIVDGKLTYIPSVSGTSISTSNLANGNHTVLFRKSSEASFGSIFLGNITTTGTFGPDIPPSSRRIEVIGDSITSAYGIGALLPCTNTAALEVISDSYSVLAAQELNADLSIISVSGIGIIRNYASGQVDTSPIMPERYTKYGFNDASGSYTFPASDAPDAVLINLGTNDFGHNNVRPKLTKEEYTAAMVKFVNYISTSYKNDPTFFLLTSPMLNDYYPAGEMVKSMQREGLNDAIKQLNGTKAYLVEWADQGSEVGCDYHPTPETNLIGKEAVVGKLREVLGW